MSFLSYTTLLTLFSLSTGLHAQLRTESILIKGTAYTAHLDQWSFSVVRAKKDTVLALSTDNHVRFEFKDFNKDGYRDVFLEWGGNLPERYTLYLFAPATASFQEVNNFSDFPASTSIQGTAYYYSYYRNGCADNAWGSDLFTIQHYTAIRVGHIKGEGCGIKDGIFVYKTYAGKKVLTETLPLNTIKRYRQGKFGFLQQYWSKKYRQFM